MKRKRTRHSSPKLDAIKLPRTEDRPGTAEKPVRIKSDQSSSSPLTAVRFRTLDEHDSVDLDEFGERNYTPRKRQRFDADHIRFSDPTPFHFTRTKALLDDYISNKAKTKTAKGVDTDMDMYNMDPGSPFSSDEDSSIQGDTEHPKPLWKAQPQNKLKRQQDDAEDDRYAQSRENKQETLEAGSKPSKTRKGAIYKDQPDVAGAGWLPTPITSRRYPNLDLNSSRRVEECETPSVLRPTDPNNQILPRTGESNKKRFPLGRRDHGAAAVHLLSEDGDVLDKPSIRDTTRTPRAAEAERRLEGLLSEPSSDKPPLPWETPMWKRRPVHGKPMCLRLAHRAALLYQLNQ